MGSSDEQDRPAEQAPGLRDGLAALVEAVLAHDAAAAGDSEELLVAARALLRRKLAMRGTKSETRQHLEELAAAHLRRYLRGPSSAGSAAAEVVLGTLLAGTMLADFASALDRAILESSAPRAVSFGGRADFISLEEVLQLLGSAKHRGCLTLEKPDNRLDVYLDNGVIAFLDPHHYIRRVIPAADRMSFREISPDLLRRGEERHAAEGIPIALTLHREGFFRDSEVRNMARGLGTEVLYEFLREQRDCAYAYRRLSELPQFATRLNFKVPVTPLLLEGNRRLDEWRSMIRVFPDPDAPLVPVQDMIAKISSLDLSVLEIKMLAQINGKVSPRRLGPAVGLPPHDLYQYLVRFAKEGVLMPPGGPGTLRELAMTIEESVEIALQALDANDDHHEVATALDKVLGFGDEQVGGERPRR